MPATASPRYLLWLLLGLAGLGLSACEETNPTGPDFEPFFQKGSVLYLGTDWTPTVITETTTVLIEVTEITERLIDAGSSSDTPVLGFALGQVVEADCITTFQEPAIVGSTYSFRLPADTYCFMMFDSGTMPQDAIFDYTLLIDP